LVLQAITHVFELVSHVATPLLGCAQSLFMQQPVDGMQVEPHCLYPELQTNPQVPLLHVAIVAFGGTGQGVHDVPHELTLALSKQFPLHSWVPPGQLPLHAIPVGMHMPKQSFCPLGHDPLHDVPSHVAVPPVGGVHGVQDMLQLLAFVESTHEPSHRWKPLLHCKPHVVPSHVAADALAVTGQAVQDMAQWSTLRSSTHVPSQECVPGSQVLSPPSPMVVPMSSSVVPPRSSVALEACPAVMSTVTAGALATTVPSLESASSARLMLPLWMPGMYRKRTSPLPIADLISNVRL